MDHADRVGEGARAVMLPMRVATAGRTLFAVAIAVLPLDAQSSATATKIGVQGLAAIVGVWQSDTTNGTSARSDCAWTPQHGAVLCEQQITTPDGPRTALNLFTFKPATGMYELYVVNQPGEPAYHVQFTIDGPIWIYGGETADAEGTTRRTVNDFSGSGSSYTWRQESRVKGGEWKVGAGGRSERVR